MQVPKGSRTVIPVEAKSNRNWQAFTVLAWWLLVILLAVIAMGVAFYLMKRVGLPGVGGR